MTTLTTFIPGKVVSWKRNRVYKGRMFRDKECIAYRKKVATFARAACPVQQLQAPIHVVMLIGYSRPGSRPKLKSGTIPAEAWASGCRVLFPSTNGHDIDRLQGNVYDGLSDAGVIGDDGHIVGCEVVKFYVAEGETPGLTLTVSECGWLI